MKEELEYILEQIDTLFTTGKNFIKYLKWNEEIKKVNFHLDEPTFSHIRNAQNNEPIINAFVKFWEKTVAQEIANPEQLKIIHERFSGRKPKNTSGLEEYLGKSFWLYVYPIKGTEIEVSTLQIDMKGDVVIKNAKRNDNGESSAHVTYFGKIENGTIDTLFFYMDTPAKDKPLYLRFYKSRGGKVTKIILGAYFKLESPSRIVVGSVILELEEDNNKIKNIQSDDFYNNHILKPTEEINQNIKDFFKDKNKNIIKLPELITDTTELGRWIEKKQRDANLNQEYVYEVSQSKGLKYDIFFAFPMTNPPKGWSDKVEKFIYAISKMLLNTSDIEKVKQKIFFHAKDKPIKKDYTPDFEPIKESKYFIMFVPNDKAGSFFVEAGYAYGCQKPSIYLVQKNHINSIPTVLSQISDFTGGRAKIITYTEEKELESQELHNRIKRELNGIEEKLRKNRI
ncbi:MAG: hypothetical protein MUE81_10965 [Thermoflexibacter sp.]|jgi:hypothetical protein|nr:hypothetical protein [Thermoflexibacter sp.]